MGGRTVRQNCKWIKTVGLPSDETGGKFSNFDHPDLLRALRGIDDYEKWVSTRLLPIVCKWIDENRDAVTKDLSNEEMNDMGTAVEAAYNIIEKSEWMKERIKESEKIDIDSISFNPIWRRQTAAYIVAENIAKESK